MNVENFISSFFKMKEDITIKVMRIFAVFILIVSVILIPIGLWKMIFESFYEKRLGLLQIYSGIVGIFCSFFVQGFIYIVKAAISYLRKNG